MVAGGETTTALCGSIGGDGRRRPSRAPGDADTEEARWRVGKGVGRREHAEQARARGPRSDVLVTRNRGEGRSAHVAAASHAPA